jgi:hypothetical protein
MKTHWTLLPAAHSRFVYCCVNCGRTSSSAPPCAKNTGICDGKVLGAFFVISEYHGSVL